MSIAKIYAQAIQDNLRATANWEPDSVRQVGDYGVMDGPIFKYLGHVGSILNTKPEPEDISVSGEKSYQSKGMTKHVTRLGAGIGPDGTEWVKAGLSLKFTGNEAVLFKMIPEKRTRMKNTYDLAYEIIRQYESGYWELDWVVVIEVTTAKSGLILVGEDANTEFQLEANVAKLEELNLSHPELNFSIGHQTQKTLNLKLGSPSTPLISTAKLNRRWFRRPIFRGADEVQEKVFYDRQAIAAENAHALQSTLGASNQEERLILEEY